MSKEPNESAQLARQNDALSRRDLFKLGIAWAVLPALSPTSENYPTVFRIIRPEDLFEGIVIFHDVKIQRSGVFSNQLVAKPKRVDESGFDVLLPAQHLLEEAFREDLTGTFKIPRRGEPRAWFSTPTRLCFVWPKLSEIKIAPSTIISALGELVPVFKKPGKGKPKDRESWIEPLTRLLITPATAAKWVTFSAPSPEAFNPVWSIQLTSDDTDNIAVNLIWTPDSEGANPCRSFPPDCPTCVTPLSSRDRCDLVSVFSGDKPSYPGCAAQPPAAPQMSPLLLSSQGSFLNATAGWDPPPSCGDLQGWTHSTSHGRDHNVEVVRKYFCHPDGIPVTVVKESARHFEAGDNNEGAGAFLRIRLLVKPTAASKVSGLSEMPFVEEVIPEQELPPIDLDPVSPGGELQPLHDGWVDPADMNALAFWPLVRGEKLKLKILCTDHQGKQHELQRSFILVSNALLESNGRLSPTRQAKVDAAWEKSDVVKDRLVDLLGRNIAVASPGKPNDTTLTAYSMDVARAAARPLSAGEVATNPFEPRLHRLSVSSDSLSTLTGATRPLSTSFRRKPGLTQDEARQAAIDDKQKGLLTPDSVEVPGQPYLGMEEKLDSGISGEHVQRFGGAVQPNINIAALGRETDLIAGDVQKYIGQQMLPGDLFAGAKLLGGIDLGSVLALLPKQPPAWIFDRSGGNPFSGIEISKELLASLKDFSQDEPDPDSADSFLGWRATFDWATAELKPFLLFKPNANTLLSVHSEIAFNALSGTGHWQSEATLREFEIAIPTADTAWISIAFDDVSVSIESGRAPLFAPRIKQGDDAIRFGQQLAFLDALRNLLKSKKGLTVDITGSYVAIRQTSNLGDKNFGAFSITGLTFTFGIRLPLTGDPLEAEFALGSISNPFAISVSGYSGAAFFQTIVTAAGPKSIAVSLEFGGDYAADFAGIAKGRAFLRAGFYFRRDGSNCVFRGFVRTGGHLDVMSIGSVNVLALVSLTCTKDVVEGSVHVEITISIGWLSITQSFDVKQSYGRPTQSAQAVSMPSAPSGRSAALQDVRFNLGRNYSDSRANRSQKSTIAARSQPKIQSLTQRMSLDDWREYWKAFSREGHN